MNIHHITRRQLDAAPSFAEVLGDFVDICRGSVVVAHNLSFEKRFLEGEFSRLRLPVPALPSICTVAATKAALSLPNYRLATIANALGFGDYAAHTALADAPICSKLISTLVTTHQLGFTRRPVYSELPRWKPALRLMPRPGDLPAVPGGWMAGLIDRMRIEHACAQDQTLEDAYVELLADALSDQHISPDETRALATMAANAGLVEQDVRRIHEIFVRSMRRVAESDEVITAAEERELRQVATALRVPALVADLPVTESITVTAKPPVVRVLVLGSSAGSDELRAAVLSSGIQLARKLTGSVTHLIVGADVPESEPRLDRARELGAAVVSLAIAAHELCLVERPVPEPRVVVDEPAAAFPAVSSPAVYAVPPHQRSTRCRHRHPATSRLPRRRRPRGLDGYRCGSAGASWRWACY